MITPEAITEKPLEEYTRVLQVREETVRAVPEICAERALLATEAYKESGGDSFVLKKAKALRRILGGMSIFIEEGQLIAGNHASKLRAAPVFPEYSYDWVIQELDEFALRSGDRFDISEETKERLRSIEGYWKETVTHQDEVEANIPSVNRQAEAQNVLHRGGISMSGDGHIIPHHEKVLEGGFAPLIAKARKQLEDEGLDRDKRDFYEASVIAMNAGIAFAGRFAGLAAEMASREEEAERRSELLEISRICGRIFKGRPESFQEAVQLVYFLHLIMMIESNGHSFSFGRFDQYLMPFYKDDLERGSLTPERAVEILGLFFIKLNTLNKVRPWGHTEFGVGYPLYSNLMVGGMTADGEDGTNDLSYLCIYAMGLCRLPEPNLSTRYWKGSPRSLVRESAKLIREGFGMPSLFADETVIRALTSKGIPERDARDYASMGCVEVAIPGRWGHRATGMTYINFGKILELLLNNGLDKKTGIQLISVNGNEGPEVEFSSYGELWSGWKKLLKYYVDMAVVCDGICDRALEKHDADPFASSLVDSCLDRGMTLKAGGGDYDFVSHSTIGTNAVADSLSAVNELVFVKGLTDFAGLRAALDADWKGEEHDRLRRLALRAPKFGNDDDQADTIAAAVLDSYLELLPSYRTERYGRGPFGCGYTMSTSNISSYVPYGMDVGATPDGRYAGKPLNEGSSPCIGAADSGPTAVLKSVSKLPNDRMAGGQLLNMKLSPSLLADDENLDKFVSLIMAHRDLGNFHIQFNVVDSATLRKAMERPAEYPDLMVRVAGYCALFTTLVPEAQEAIADRAEYGEF